MRGDGRNGHERKDRVATVGPPKPQRTLRGGIYVARRKPNPSTFDDRRAAVRYRLVDEIGISGAMADQWVRVWEMEAASRDLRREKADYWVQGIRLDRQAALEALTNARCAPGQPGPTSRATLPGAAGHRGPGLGRGRLEANGRGQPELDDRRSDVEQEGGEQRSNRHGEVESDEVATAAKRHDCPI
jgi:hypothetical protein